MTPTWIRKSCRTWCDLVSHSFIIIDSYSFSVAYSINIMGAHHIKGTWLVFSTYLVDYDVMQCTCYLIPITARQKLRWCNSNLHKVCARQKTVSSKQGWSKSTGEG